MIKKATLFQVNPLKYVGRLVPACGRLAVQQTHSAECVEVILTIGTTYFSNLSPGLLIFKIMLVGEEHEKKRIHKV
jgi:hypothetical protein